MGNLLPTFQLSHSGASLRRGVYLTSLWVTNPAKRLAEKIIIKAGRSAKQIWPGKPNKAHQKDVDARWTVKVGGKVRYAGANPHNVIGDGARPWWDAILVVEYPSPQAFVDMVRDPAYQKVHEHRAAALEQGDLVATSQWLAG